MQLNLKIGDISYLNTLPLRVGLTHFGVKEVFLGTPTEVNEALLRGEIDLGPVSSIFYLENQEELLALKEICIGSKDEVKSVVLVSRYPLRDLDGKTISLTRASATSRHLLQIIFKEKDLNPLYVEGEFEMFEEKKVDASLLIGDRALHTYLNCSQKGKSYLYDLGKEWRKLTGKPMVYAFWVVRKEVASFNPSLVERASKVLFAALRKGISHLDLVVKKASKVSGINKEQLKDYYRTLNYHFSEEFLLGLMEFYRRALPGEPRRIEFFPSNEASLSRYAKCKLT
jgi:chorismate dehydratase